MPSNKPRVTVTLNPYVHDTIRRMAQLQGRSRGAVIADLLEGVHQPLMRTVVLLEAARGAPKQVIDGLRGALESMERELSGSAGVGLSNVDWLTGEIKSCSDELSEEADSGMRGAEKAQPSARAAASNPRITRGSSRSRARKRRK